MSKFLALGLALALVASGVAKMVYAAGLSGSTASTTPQTTGAASQMTIDFRAVTATANNDKVEIGLPDGFTVKSGALTPTTDYQIFYDASSPPTTDRTAGSSATGSNTAGSKGATITLNGTNAIAANDYVRVILNITTITANPASQGFYQVGIKTLDTSAADATIDYGAAVVSIGDEEDVTVTAEVKPTLSFAIRNAADTADLTNNACDLGTLSTGTVSTCDYRLKVATNADDGYTVQITSDGNLRDGAKAINAITEDGTVTAGTEGYGLAFVGGSATNGAITEEGNFNDDDTPIPTSATNLYSSNGPNAPAAVDTTNTALVTHRAAIDAATEGGVYTQVVTYSVTADF